MSTQPHHYFDLENVHFSSIFDQNQPIWTVLGPKIKENWIKSQIQPNANLIQTEGGLVTKHQVIDVSRGTFEVFPGAFIKDQEIEIREGCVIESGAFLAGPTILGKNTTIRHGAYIRGGVITGSGCIIGHASEVKSSIFLNDAKAAHFAYVGDSILGNGVNLGAGTKISNLKITNAEIVIRTEGKEFQTGLRKFGAILGDDVQTGCNSVLNPGAMLGAQCMVYPNASVKGVVFKEKSIIR